MDADASLNVEAASCQFSLSNPEARFIAAPSCGDHSVAVGDLSQYAGDVFEKLTYGDSYSNDWVDHQLTRPVVGQVPAPRNLYQPYAAPLKLAGRKEQVFFVTAAPAGNHWIVLAQDELPKLQTCDHRGAPRLHLPQGI